MTGRPTLRARIEDPRILVAMGVHDGLTTLIAQRVGFEALYHGGYAAAAAHYGLPDIGLLGLEEMCDSVRRVTGVASRPVIADCDTGYGGVAAVRRAMTLMEAAGVAAIQIEDQVFPKRCGHLEGKQVIDRDEMVLKVSAAVQARTDAETLIIARTDALQPHGLDDAIDRCNAYAEAGADLLFVDAPQTREQLEQIARRVDGPTIANMSETGRTPALSAAELEALGYSVVIFPSTQIWAIARAFEELCREVLEQGTSRGLQARLMPFAEVNELLGLDRWDALSEPAAPPSAY